MGVAASRGIEFLSGPSLARHLVARDRRHATRPLRHDVDEQPRQRPCGLGRDHLANRAGLEGARLAAVGVEHRAHHLRLHQPPPVRDGAERGDELERGDRDLLADRHRRERQPRPVARVTDEPATLARQADPGRAAEAEIRNVAVVAVATEREPDPDRADVRGVLEHLGEGEPAVFLPVADGRAGDGDHAVAAVDPIGRLDDAFLERPGGEDHLEGRPGLERVGDRAVAPLVAGRRREAVRIEGRPDGERQDLPRARIHRDRHRGPRARPPVRRV